MAGNAYSVTHQTAAGADLGIIAIGSDGTVQVKMYDLMIGSDATPADLAGEFMVSDCTTVGAGGTALTPRLLNFQTVAASSTASGGTYGTTEPANGTDILMIALNQRATFRWVAAPGSELVGPATSGDGFFLSSVAHGGTPNINATILFME